MFDPKTRYEVIPEKIPIKDFYDYWDDFVVRPPYQRKSVWSKKKQQALLDSLFRRYYIPKIVIREVRLSEEATKKEIIDGQQRIITVKLFFDSKLALPDSLSDVSANLKGKLYKDLSTELKKFSDKKLFYDADLIKGIENPKDSGHQRIASEIFWRLQQGENLTFMEIAHSRLSSLSRNYVVKYADDISFDYENYIPVDNNPNKHKFFKVIERNNDRMQHLALLTRLLILEEKDGPSDIKDVNVMEYIDKYQRDDGIGNLSFEEERSAKETIRLMSSFYEIFRNDPMIANGESGVKELSTEYFIISIYLLLRHIVKYYVFDSDLKQIFRDFVIDFHQRWKLKSEDDNDINIFSDSRQQSETEIDTRHRIIRQVFFEYLDEKNHQIRAKDTQRVFNEREKISIYRRDRGLCQSCLSEGKIEKECQVSWKEYEADHILPYIKGGPTAIENAQVLCRYHNRQKGASI